MQIAIVDDEAAQRAALAACLSPALERRGLRAQVLEYDSGEAFLSACGRESFSLVFLDIYMGAMNGLETARAFRARFPACPLVLVTTSTEHALEAYRVRAMQYLVKPVQPSDIQALLDELPLRKSALPPEPVIEAKDGRQTIRLRQRDILWADNYQHQIHIHLLDGRTVTVRTTFREFAALFDMNPRFFVCGRGVLVNLSHVRDFDGRAFLLPGAQVPVSRDLTAKARAAFGEWLFHQQEGGRI